MSDNRRIEEVGTTVVDASVRVHRELGPGLLESVYQACLALELRNRGMSVECEVAFPVRYSSVTFSTAFRVDMLVEDLVLVENKAVQAILPVHHAQLLTYLKLSGRNLGYLINWHVPVIREGLHRIVHRL